MSLSQRRSQRVPSTPAISKSSTSSISSGRAERSTRSHQKLPSPKRSMPPRSQSLEDLDDGVKSQPRRIRNGQEDIRANIGDEDEEEGEEEEVTRCICGHTDYPGLPASTLEALKLAANNNPETNSSSNLVPEDMGGLFIQCDICKVWQHGGCVGILDEGMSPEEYFCEQCRKDLHKITTAPNGQKYSRYLPVQDADSPPASPEPADRDGHVKKPKNPKTRPSAEALAHKRRLTMNSRDAAYDEVEQLRRAIEESKKVGGGAVDSGSRRNKRSRSGSEEHGIKRQRTTSGSSSSPSNIKKSQEGVESEDDAGLAGNQNDGAKKIRGAAARNHREKELRDREKEREKERADAAGRRKGRAERAERRRGDDSDPSEEHQSRTTTFKASDPSINKHSNSSRPSPDTPPASQDVPPPKTSHKKTGRPPARRGRVGRNQYTRDRDMRLDAPHNVHSHHGSLDAMDHSPRRSRSRDPTRTERGNTPLLNGNGGHYGVWGEGGRPSKPKHMNPNRTSMNEMKRRVAGILEFVGRTQVEMVGEANGKMDGNGRSPNDGDSHHSGSADRNNDASPGREKQKQQQALAKGLMDSLGGLTDEGVGDKEFAGLGSVEMMEVLMRKLIRWQRDHGKWGEKS
ncbi:hypothetical protein MMC06_002038 [Schaereria dolodes]|nr:hypothetical protein [Schaereria dolodes]